MTKLIKNSLGVKPDRKIYLPDVSKQTKKITHDIFSSKECLKLLQLTENNPWHKEENVFEHVSHVFANLQILITFGFVKSEELKKKYINYFGQSISNTHNFLRKDLFLISCSLHDIGKIKTLKTLENGTTISTGHELASVVIAKNLLRNVSFSKEEQGYIYYIIDRHDFFNLDFCNSKLTKNPFKDFTILKKIEPHYALELLLHIIADEYGAKITLKWRNYLLYKVIAEYPVFN
ncbi:hypothetical protein A2955_04935 [Candidatus Woesebacteria bacterium RIFCSPLOWO2_01_FULL_37_19]|uniref:HD domain-containing protein n=2 Tax=Candidatus Woeseibacteriota TaxID=1752722 RepID=A0A1F8BBQ3_9BACT|nr:MAG: hypothetical protein A2771_02980 [Candidatus Woesebacteria bacterium RIFCSPHIGHO2_01_FULL_38_26b]OGM61360.1 MAG: hypothetical protein A2955_04935 [Candidatus Woesebacteria bacterium RIFCSPLOWO2_01_FULL_37_19]